MLPGQTERERTTCGFLGCAQGGWDGDQETLWWSAAVQSSEAVAGVQEQGPVGSKASLQTPKALFSQDLKTAQRLPKDCLKWAQAPS